MADPNRKGCDSPSVNQFSKQGGITNGAQWYSLAGGAWKIVLIFVSTQMQRKQILLHLQQ